MTDTFESIACLATIMARSTDRSVSTISRLASGSGATIQRLVGGHDITTRRAARIVQWLSDHWPPGAEWPADIPRPDPAPDSPAAAPPPAPEPPAGAPADPLAAVGAARERRLEAMDRGDWDAAQTAADEAVAAALVLGPDGQVASPTALCRALAVRRYVYDDVVRRYRDGAGSSTPRAGSDCDRVLTALLLARDTRFASRARAAA